METEPIAPNSRQVGGHHYSSRDAGYQHWDLAADTGMGYFEGVITKYITRWREKDGVKDVEKALHYCEKLTELVGQSRQPERKVVDGKVWEAFAAFLIKHQLNRLEQLIFELCIARTCAHDLDRMHMYIEELLEKARRSHQQPTHEKEK